MKKRIITQSWPLPLLNYTTTFNVHRVWRDVWGPQDEKDVEPNAFVQLLWERGIAYEKERLLLAGELVDIHDGTIEERAAHTITALKNRAFLIYQGVLQVDELLGIPDFLRREPNGSYIP